MSTRKRKLRIKEQDIAELIEAGEFAKEFTKSLSIAKPSKPLIIKPFESHVVVFDTHIPHQNLPALKCIWQIMDDYVFDGFTHGGDFLDLGCISHWNKDKSGKVEGQRLLQDYIMGNAILNEFDKRLPKNAKKEFYFGNHERFYQDLIDQQPALTGLFHPTNELRLKERGYIVHEEQNHKGNLGKLRITHGAYTSLHKHLVKFGTNVMHGHIHTMGTEMVSTIGHDIALVGYSVGCTCDLNAEFMAGQPSAWTHGFAVVNVYPNGYFDVDLKRIIKGTCTYNGKFYDGNK